MPENKDEKIIPVVLSGGSGTRLWPVSRTLYPKQLQSLVTGKSLLQDTVERLSGDRYGDPIIICNDEHRFIIAEQVREIGANGAHIVLEPVGRNTAPATAVSAILAEKSGADPVILVAPSDHAILNAPAFQGAIETALAAALGGKLVTFGITPTSAETGYGYIRCPGAATGAAASHDVEAYVEKPDTPTAEQYLKDGGYFWNSGIFLFRASVFLAELEQWQPEMASYCRQAVNDGQDDLDFIRLAAPPFEAITANSIDYAVMEKTKNAQMVAVDMGWSDVGSWDALWELSKRDSDGNAAIGDVVLQDVTGSYVRSEHKLVAAVGIKDLIVVVTDDAVLVADRAEAQKVKNLVDALKDDARGEYVSHTKVYRPWGWYQSLEIGERFQVKLIGVSPGAKISLQLHHKRAEHWVVVSGRATVTRGEEIVELRENQSTYIPVGVKHRLENQTDAPLTIVEIQSGSYLGEDDIERFDDQYGRD
jgi:mannose-1-phosphate guanylyltransferase/mannose-6-phosphate isomerase